MSQRDGDGIDNFAENVFGSFRFLLKRGMARAGDDAMREYGDGELLEVVWEAKIAAVEEGAGLRGALEHQGAARADAERQVVRLASAIDDFQRVVMEAGVDFDARDGVLHSEHVRNIGNRLENGDCVVGNAAAKNRALGFVRGITHFDAHEEAVELGFRKRVSAMMLDGILRGDNEKGLGEGQGTAVDSDLRLVHGFE